MIQLINYSELVKEDGKKFLFDSRTYKAKCEQLTRLEEIFLRISDALKDSNYSLSWAVDVVRSGATGLRTKIAEDLEKKVSKMSLPPAVVKYWQSIAINDIPEEVASLFNDLSREANKEMDGLPPIELIAGDSGVSVNRDEIIEKIRLGCSMEINPEIEAAADKLSGIAEQMIAIEKTGVNGREILSKLMESETEPSENELLRMVATRTHKPGTLWKDYTLLDSLNRIKNLTNNNL